MVLGYTFYFFLRLLLIFTYSKYILLKMRYLLCFSRELAVILHPENNNQYNNTKKELLWLSDL